MSRLRIRPARAGDLERLPDVERSAAERFGEVGLGWVAEAGTLPAYVLRTALGRGTLWVAPDRGDSPAGFLAACELDGALFVIELSVAREHQGRGLGSALLDQAVAHAARAGMAAVTLTTFRDVPWNAPFYARRGFVELDPAALGPGLRARLAAEVAAGHEPGRRCAMARVLAPRGA
ncbi:GNAT family N-acetyltransferase [Marinimicrococcus flavescens]|uniref:GNAT family N-acetyltransferase n=1 Tax=Marinimicrococcus flavescens TaxID=3031815 RepID=A0AAP3XPP8_9PROT|nr:GNAT family N-acetyltransferase [Marinimicrococcus flavescens]